MTFAGKVWRLLVGIKDGLALLFLLLFFGLIYLGLSARPNPAQIREGALLLELDGSIVEEASPVDPLDVLLSGTVPPGEFPARDLVRAIDAAAKDKRIKAIAIDMSRFLGGGQVHLSDVGAALDRFRAADKKVLAYATAYMDESLLLAAHADEIWADPMGGAVVRGPGGSNLYYAGLLDKLKINAHVFRVGTHKSAVEPFLRQDMSPEARADRQALNNALWEEWRADFTKARPTARLGDLTRDPAGWLAAARGDLARAARSSGLIDRIGDRAAFGRRVAELAGKDPYDSAPGTFAHTDLPTWLADVGEDRHGRAIGVITIAGEIVDGDAGPGVAGGERIAGLLDDALEDDLAALVVRVDSPGGSVMASEEIRRAIMRHKARGIPVAVSMANVAASGGYWVATPAQRIFAEPATITGSIGIFAVVPTFEKALGDWGVSADGVRTTPLSGQPDLLSGLTPEVEAMVQDLIRHGYARFLGLVAQARGKNPAEVNAIAQGRVWDGGTARQIGLIDQYGGVDDALAWAARQAKLKDGKWHAKYLGVQDDPYHMLLNRLVRGEEGNTGGAAMDPVALLLTRQQGLNARLAADWRRLTTSGGAQAFCLECPVSARARPARGDLTLLGVLSRLIG